VYRSSLAFTVVQESILVVFFVDIIYCVSLDSGAGAEGGSRVYKAVVLINRLSDFQQLPAQPACCPFPSPQSPSRPQTGYLEQFTAAVSTAG